MQHQRHQFRHWHRRAFVTVLAENLAYLRARGVTGARVSEKLHHNGRSNQGFQKMAVHLIKAACGDVYFSDSRIRSKLLRFNLRILPGRLERRVTARLSLLREWCAPRIVALVFRTYWNGWVTTARMKELFRKTGQTRSHCLLGCGWDEDSLDHYILCGKLWDFIREPAPSGLGLQGCERSRETILLLAENLSDEAVIKLALALYATYRIVNLIRFSRQADGIDIAKLLKLYANRGADGSRAKQLLHSQATHR